MNNQCKEYDLNSESKDFWLHGKVLHVLSCDGANFGYILFIPQNISEYTTMVIEGSNAAISSNSLDEANRNILNEGLKLDQPIFKVANELGLPVIYPLFPRIDNGNETIYNHMLSSNSLSDKTKDIDSLGLKRVDLQLIAMIDDAKKRLKERNIETDEQCIINGFSASAKFANRFTLLHPEMIKLCIGGGVSGVLTLPLANINGEKLLWPVGVGNLKELGNIDITEDQIGKFKEVEQFYYMGSNDTESDPFVADEGGKPKYKGIISEEELNQMHSLFGSNIMDRWPKAQKIYNYLGVNATFKTYLGYGHNPKPAEEDIKEKIEKVLYEKSKSK